MNRSSRILVFVMLLVGLTCGCREARGNGERITSHPEGQPSPTAQAASMPHITMDRQRRLIDIDAVIVMREGGWLELLACLPGTRTHESILAVRAKPSHIHLALLLLGLEPGAPLTWVEDGEGFRAVSPHGPAVAVSIVVGSGTEAVEHPANKWVFDRRTGESPQDNIWVFAGSKFKPDSEEQPETTGQVTDTKTPTRYVADSEGSVVSLVNFGDEVLARPITTTHQNDQGAWEPRTDRIPATGTPVRLRLRPVD